MECICIFVCCCRETPPGDKHYIVLIFDTTKQIQKQAQYETTNRYLQQLAHQDSLTRLPNRFSFSETLRREMLTARTAIDRKLALLYFDLNGFKSINDEYGHHAGDKLLKTIAARLRKRVRNKHHLARIGSDEFTLIYHCSENLDLVRLEAESIVKAIEKPIRVGPEDISIKCCIGISIFPDQAKRPEDLLRQADTAMYVAKSDGQKPVVFYSSKSNSSHIRKRELKTTLAQAVDSLDLQLYFQPILCCRTLNTKSMECLLRWKHPKHGIVSPSEFIPICEENEAIKRIGLYVFERACDFYVRSNMMQSNTKLAVNISPKQLLHNDFCKSLESILSSAGLKAAFFELELTEGCNCPADSQTYMNLCRLSEMGFHLSVDDFGAGFSSLSRLIDFPFSQLKVDRSIITRVHLNERNRMIVNGLLRMAQDLGMTVVAEGIENAMQHQALLDAKCDMVQGYLFSKPVNERGAQNWLNSTGVQHALST